MRRWGHGLALHLTLTSLIGLRVSLGCGCESQPGGRDALCQECEALPTACVTGEPPQTFPHRAAAEAGPAPVVLAVITGRPSANSGRKL